MKPTKQKTPAIKKNKTLCGSEEISIAVYHITAREAYRILTNYTQASGSFILLQSSTMGKVRSKTSGESGGIILMCLVLVMSILKYCHLLVNL